MSESKLETIETESVSKTDELSNPPATTPARRWYSNSLPRRISPFRIFLCLIFVSAVFTGLYFYAFGNRSLSQDFGTARSSSKEAMTTAAVKIEFSLNKRFANDMIGITTNEGTVTLVGYVDSEEDKALAEDVVRNTRGVRGVVNNLKTANKNTGDQQGKILDTKSADLVKRTAVLEALIACKDLAGQEIKVDSNNGTVILEGHVDTEQQKDIALLTANKIEGVTEVNADRLIVNGQTDKHNGPASSKKEYR